MTPSIITRSKKTGWAEHYVRTGTPDLWKPNNAHHKTLGPQNATKIRFRIQLSSDRSYMEF